MMMLPSVFNDRFFDDFMDFPFERRFNSLKPARRFEGGLMKTDVKGVDGGYEFLIDLPGFKKDEINIKLDNGYLTVSAEKHSEENDGEKNGYIRRERWYGKCSRSFFVGKEAKPDDIKARMEDGILKLSVPKKEAEIARDTQILIEE